MSLTERISACFCKGMVFLLAGAMLLGCSQTAPNLPEIQAAAEQQLIAPQVNTVSPLTEEQQQQFLLSQQLMNSQQYNEAKAALAALSAQRNEFAAIWYNLALCHWHTADIAAAEHSLQQAIAAEPDFSHAYNLLGVISRQQGQFRQAERYWQQSIQHASDSKQPLAAAHKNLAFLYELYLGLPQQAAEHYQQYYQLTKDEQAKIWLALIQQQMAQAAEEQL